jgi:hypothetical protein
VQECKGLQNVQGTIAPGTYAFPFKYQLPDRRPLQVMPATYQSEKIPHTYIVYKFKACVVKGTVLPNVPTYSGYIIKVG